MSKNRGLRSIGFCAFLGALMIQGMTPDTESLVAPWLLRSGFLYVAGDDYDACRDRTTDEDRPGPSKDAENDGAPDEVCDPTEPGA